MLVTHPSETTGEAGGELVRTMSWVKGGTISALGAVVCVLLGDRNIVCGPNRVGELLNEFRLGG
jgi:hypothetical protein